MRYLLGLLILVTTSFSPASAEGVELSWSTAEPAALIFNGHRIEYDDSESIHATVDRILVVCPELKTDNAGAQEEPIHVLIPGKFDSENQWESSSLRIPNLPGRLRSLYEAFTCPPRKVIYHQDGKTLRRYIIRCSDKDTANDPLKAHYWLDDQFLGTWEKAEPHFTSMSWEKQAMVEYVMDAQPLLSSSGIGLHVPQTLKNLFWENQITVNLRMRYRSEKEQ